MPENEPGIPVDKINFINITTMTSSYLAWQNIQWNITHALIKGHHRFQVIINKGQKKSWDKNFDHDSRG